MPAGQRVTTGKLNRAIDAIKRNPEHANLRAGAQLLGYDVTFGDGGVLLYRGGIYPDRAALVEELLIDLGIKTRSH